jgi:hypothetical protein
MKVALEQGESLEVAILQNDRVVGTLSMRLQGVGTGSVGATRQQSAPAAPSAVPAKRGRKRGRRAGGRRNISPEARAKMAEAQRKRWAKFRQDKKK